MKIQKCKILNRIRNPKSEMRNRLGFSLVELIIVIVIIGILSVVSYVAIQKAGEKAKNEKMLNDLIAISSALEDYKRDHSNKYPIPKPDTTTKPNQNIICYYMDATYAHSCKTEDGAVFTQGMIDNAILSQRYLRQVPLDPRTGSRYVYGVTNDGAYFQVAGIYEEGDDYRARVVGNLAKGFELPSIIRAFDKADFVIDKGANLPYSSNATEITGTLDNLSGTGITIKSDTKTYTQPEVKNGFVVKNKDVITTAANNTVDIYFSDGSITHVDANSELELKNLKVEKNDGTGTVTSILIKLNVGKIWNKVVRLGEKSEFNVETTTAIAGVRGTEFGVEKAEGSNPVVTVLSGEVGLYANVAALSGSPGAKLTGTITTPAAYSVSNSTTASITTTPNIIQYYKDIPLGINMRPILLSVKGDTQTIVAQNINYYVDSTDSATNRAAFKGGRKIDATHLTAYEDNQGTVKVNITNNPFSISGQTTNHSFPGLPLNKPIYLRFEKISGSTVVRSSAFTTPITIKSGTNLSKTDLSPQTVSTEKPELTLTAPGFGVVSTTKSFDLGLSLSSSYAFKTGDKYNVKINSGPCSSPAVTGTGDIAITAQSIAKTLTFTAPSAGICSITVQANVGSTSLIKTATVNVVAATDKLALTYPADKAVLAKAGLEVTFKWEAMNAPTTATYEFWFDGKSEKTGIADKFYKFTLHSVTKGYKWKVRMMDGGAEITSKEFDLTVATAVSANFNMTAANLTQVGSTNQYTVQATTAPIPVTVTTPSTTGYDYEWAYTNFTGPATTSSGGTYTVSISGVPSASSKYFSITLTMRDQTTKNVVDTITKGITASSLPVITGIQFASATLTTINAGSTTPVNLPAVTFSVAGQQPASLSPSEYTCTASPNKGVISSNTTYSIPTASASQFTQTSTPVNITCTLSQKTGYTINSPRTTQIPFKITVTKTATTPSLAQTCASQYNGIWDTSTNGCWFVAGSASESCTTVCSGKSGLTCKNDTSSWTISSTLCTALSPVGGPSYSLSTATWASDYSPVIDASSKCKNDTDNSRKCGDPASGPYKRICKCVK